MNLLSVLLALLPILLVLILLVWCKMAADTVKDLTGLTRGTTNQDARVDKDANPSDSRGDLSGLGTVLVNATQGFEGVPEDVWKFHIGGYQVCQKWLKDRRGRQLSKEDIVHYQKIVYALGETIELMKQVDEAIDVHGGGPMR
ncbi:MAG: type ISP restriction/modification enzyme [Chloroflexota bacterium]